MLLLLGIAVTMADWTFGTARFTGSTPANSMSIGGVNVWYDGTLTHTHCMGGVDCYKGTGNICVAFPKGYKGRHRFCYFARSHFQMGTTSMVRLPRCRVRSSL